MSCHPDRAKRRGTCVSGCRSPIPEGVGAFNGGRRGFQPPHKSSDMKRASAPGISFRNQCPFARTLLAAATEKLNSADTIAFIGVRPGFQPPHKSSEMKRASAPGMHARLRGLYGLRKNSTRRTRSLLSEGGGGFNPRIDPAKRSGLQPRGFVYLCCREPSTTVVHTAAAVAPGASFVESRKWGTTNTRGPRGRVFVRGVVTGVPADASLSVGWMPGAKPNSGKLAPARRVDANNKPSFIFALNGNHRPRLRLQPRNVDPSGRGTSIPIPAFRKPSAIPQKPARSLVTNLL